VTRLAGDASIKKRLGPEVIVGAERRLHAGRVTVEAASVHLEGEKAFPRASIDFGFISHTRCLLYQFTGLSNQ